MNKFNVNDSVRFTRRMQRDYALKVCKVIDLGEGRYRYRLSDGLVWDENQLMLNSEWEKANKNV